MNVAVYCASRENLGEKYEAPAIALGKWLGENGHTLVYGGVKSGLMHTVAQAAHDAGAHIVGVVPERFVERADAVVDEVETGGTAEVRVLLYPEEKEIGRFTIQVSELESRTCLFPKPFRFSSDEMDMTGSVLGVELSPTCMYFIVENELAELLSLTTWAISLQVRLSKSICC